MASAAISAGASILGSIAGGKGASKAAKAQIKAYQQGLAQQQQQYQQTRSDNLPFLNFGQSAISPLGNLVGVNGNDAQQQAISALQQSPLFTAQDQAGQDALLQTAAATGGLRGGNLQGALYNQRSSLLANVIQNQLSNLGGIVGIGQNTGSTLGSLGQSNANAQSQIYGQLGGAQAFKAAAPYQAFASALQGLGSAIGGGLGGGGGSGGFGSTAANGIW